MFKKAFKRRPSLSFEQSARQTCKTKVRVLTKNAKSCKIPTQNECAPFFLVDFMWIKNLDEVDNEIIDILVKNARASYSDVAKAVGLSRTAVKSRIDELERKGVITGYHAVVSPQKATETVTLMMDVEVVTEHFEKAKNYFVQSPEAVSVMQTTGNSRLVIICKTSSLQDMKDFVNKVCSEVEGAISINAHAVLSVFKGDAVS